MNCPNCLAGAIRRPRWRTLLGLTGWGAGPVCPQCGHATPTLQRSRFTDRGRCAIQFTN